MDTSVPMEFRRKAARHVLRGLREAGATVVSRARSPHGSDCDCGAGGCPVGDDIGQARREPADARQRVLRCEVRREVRPARAGRARKARQKARNKADKGGA